MSPLFCLESPTIDERNLAAYLVKVRRDSGSFGSRQKAAIEVSSLGHISSAGFVIGIIAVGNTSPSHDKSCEGVLLRQTSKPLRSMKLWEEFAGKLEAGSRCCNRLQQVLAEPVLSLS